MFFDSVRQGFKETVVFQLAFPHHYQIPAELAQLFFRLLVPLDVPFEFLLPEFNIRGGRCCLSAAMMPMPEAPTHLNHSSVFRENNIGMPWQGFYMETKSKSLSMQKRTNCQFRNRVLRRNLTHVPTSFLRRKGIH